jgi:hypothetical protein
MIKTIMFKHLITGGCSFSHYSDEDSWINNLTTWLKKSNPNLTHEHTGYRSQGQEMIQKKVMLAIMDALESGIKEEEIIVVVMWSGTYRKACFGRSTVTGTRDLLWLLGPATDPVRGSLPDSSDISSSALHRLSACDLPVSLGSLASAPFP